jgi:hypothetical protein
VLGSICRRSEDSLSTIRRPLAATLTRIADGFFCRYLRVASSLAADFRRARIRLLRTVFRVLKAGLNCQERFPFSSITSVRRSHRRWTELVSAIVRP